MLLPFAHNGDKLISDEVSFLPPEVILGLRLATVYLWDDRVNYGNVVSEFIQTARASESDKNHLFSLFRFSRVMEEIVNGRCPAVTGISRPAKPKVIHIGLGMLYNCLRCTTLNSSYMKFSMRQNLRSHLRIVQ